MSETRKRIEDEDLDPEMEAKLQELAELIGGLLAREWLRRQPDGRASTGSHDRSGTNERLPSPFRGR